MTGIIGAIFSPSENKLPEINVLVVDKDKNIASKFLLGAFDSRQLKEMFRVSVVDEAEGKKLISKGSASALLVIPEKFTDRLVKAEKSEFLLIKNPSQRFLPNIVEEFITTFSIVISGVIQVFEPEIKAVNRLLNTPLEQVSIAAMTPFLEQGKSRMVTVKNYLFPLLIQLKEEVTGKKKEGPGLNIFSVVLPGMSIMFLLFIIDIFLRDILSEREDGKLQRMMFAPIRTMEYVFARIISGWMMGICVYLVLIILGILLFDIAWGNYLYLFLFTAVTCSWIAGFFALLNSFFKNRNQAGAFSAPIILVFSAFGGSILPINQLPDAFQWVSLITLNQWFIRGVDQIRSGVFPSIPFGILLLSRILLFLFASQSLKKRITV